MLDSESADDSCIARVRDAGGILDSTNVVLAVLPSDPTSGQPNGGVAVAARGVPRVLWLCATPKVYFFHVPS